MTRPSAYPLLIVFAVLLIYGPLFHAVYGFGDDFVLFFSEQTQEHAFLSDGRPIFALSQFLFHRHTAELADLWRFRFLCGVGVAAIAVVFFEQLRRFGGDRVERAGIAIALATLPCMQTYVAQAVTWLSPFAGLAAIGAAGLTQRAGHVRTSLLKRFALILFAAFLMLVAAATYQPMLSWYWSIAFMMTLDRRFLRSREYRKWTWSVLLWGFVYFAICFLALKSFFWLTDLAPKSRIELTRNPFEKVYWFLRIQLPQALSFWWLMEVPSGLKRLLATAVAGSLILFTYVLTFARLHRMKRNQMVPRPGFWLLIGWMITSSAALVLTHVHWLVIADVPQSYRIIAPLGVSVFIAAYWAGIRWSIWISSPQTRRWVRQATSICVAILGATVAQRYSERYWIEPHQMAYRVLLNKIRQNVDSSTKQIHVIRQATDEGLSGRVFIECFARPAFEREWAIGDLVRLGIRDSGVKTAHLAITCGSSDEPIPDEEGTVVLDMRTITSYRRPAEIAAAHSAQ